MLSITKSAAGFELLMISVAAGILITILVFFISEYAPTPIARLLNIPGVIILTIDKSTRTPPLDDAPILEAGRDILNYYIGVVLNIPFYSLVVFAFLLLRAKRKAVAEGFEVRSQ